MKIEIYPQESSRAEAFSMWMSSPMPMVTLAKRDKSDLSMNCNKEIEYG